MRRKDSEGVRDYGPESHSALGFTSSDFEILVFYPRAAFQRGRI